MLARLVLILSAVAFTHCAADIAASPCELAAEHMLDCGMSYSAAPVCGSEEAAQAESILEQSCESLGADDKGVILVLP